MDQRVFFPRDVHNAEGVPFLLAVARRLVELASADDPKNLSLERFVCVLPGSRAIRTLEAYLAQCAQEGVDSGRFNRDWTPPAFLRIGEAPEKLYEQTRPIASNLTRLVCERRALEIFLTDPRHRETALALFPCRSGDDPPTRLQELVENRQNALKLAQTFLTLDQKLANERKSWFHVAQVCKEKGLEQEEKRWSAIGELRKLYLEQLRETGFVDLNDSREFALKQRKIGTSAFDSVNGRRREYFVVGAVDLDRQQKDVFDALGDRVQYWVFAPTATANGVPKTEFDRYFDAHLNDFFDAYGCVVPERWDPERAGDRVPFMAPIPEENVFQVETPKEQGEAVALLARELSLVDAPAGDGNDYLPIAPEQLTVGAPDSEAIPFVEDALLELGYATIRGEGTRASQNRVFRALELIAEYLETRSYDTLGKLLRLPDLERLLCREWNAFPFDSGRQEDPRRARDRELDEAAQAQADETAAEEAESGGDTTNAAADALSNRCELWLREFDEYRSRFLPTRVDRQWFVSLDQDNERRNRYFVNLRKASRMLDKLLEAFFEQNDSYVYNSASASNSRSGVDALHDDVELLRVTPDSIDFDQLKLKGNVSFSTRQTKRALHEWTDPIAKLTRAIYDAPLDNREEQAQVHGFFKAFHQGLDSLDKVPSFEDGSPERAELVTGAFALRTLLSEVGSKSVPPAPGARVVEIQGWLDLLFDDAPYCVLTSFNEHVVPSTQSSDLFLPNETRQKLGLSDASRVFARDAYLTYALARSRDAFFVVFEKRSLNNDPRVPSRFLFATSEEQVPSRVVKYFGAEGGENFERLRKRHESRNFPLRALKGTTRLRYGRSFSWSETLQDHVCWLDDQNGDQGAYCRSLRLADVEALEAAWRDVAIPNASFQRLLDELSQVGVHVDEPSRWRRHRGKEYEWNASLDDYCAYLESTRHDGQPSRTTIRLSTALYLYTVRHDQENTVREILSGKRTLDGELDGIRPCDIEPEPNEWSNGAFYRFWREHESKVRRVSKRLKTEYSFRAPILTLEGESPATISTYAQDSPAPERDGRRPFVMNATDFQKFLHSPYCYFLSQYYRLQPSPTDSNELDAGAFGSIVHDVLRDFGLDEEETRGGRPIRDVDDEHILFRWLSARLDEHAKKAFNCFTSPFVHVQLEEIRSRLRAFAGWQARWRRSGRKIMYVERAAKLKVADLSAGPTESSHRGAETTIIQGRVDRIDYCEKEDRWYVFDYKTFDVANRGSVREGQNGDFFSVKADDSDELLLSTRPRNVVDARHRQKVKDEPLPQFFATRYGLDDLATRGQTRWTNLQLPLYLHFLEKIANPSPASATTLGYIVLTKTEVHAFGAPWSSADLRYADVVCRWVVDSIWRLFDEHIVDPNGSVDEFLPILDLEKLKNYDDFAPVTLSYLDEN